MTRKRAAPTARQPRVRTGQRAGAGPKSRARKPQHRRGAPSTYDPARALERAEAELAAIDQARGAAQAAAESEPIREARRIAEAFAPTNMKLLVGLSREAIEGRKVSASVWKVAELLRWQLEVGGLKRGFEIDAGPSEGFKQFMRDWYAQRAASGQPGATPALSGVETVEAVLLEAGELAEPTADIEGEEERDDDGDDWSEDEHAGATTTTREAHGGVGPRRDAR